MKRFLSKNGIWLLAGVAVVVVVLCIISAVSSGTPFLRNAAGVIASPFRSAGSAVAGWFGGIGDHFDKVADLQQENDDLRAQVADLERQLRQAQKESEENQRLRDLLELQSQRRDLKTVSARVTERSVSNWASTLTPLGQSLQLLLKLLRETGVPQWVAAEKGVFQQAMPPGRSFQLLRLRIDPSLNLVPEISGNRLLVSVRLLRPENGAKPQPCSEDASFEVTLCS